MRTAFQKAYNIASRSLYVKQNYKRAKTISLPYLRHRIMRPMLKVYNQLLKLNTPKAPWMSPASIHVFKSILTKEMQGFEYGSGNSTIFFALLCKKLVSIEHHQGWYKKVKNDLEHQAHANIDYHLVKAYDAPGETIEYLKQSIPHLKVLKEYHAYFSFIDRYENAYFDFVIVDGRARPECIWHSMPKVKPGGFIVLDNAERNRYKPVHELLKNWKKVYTTTGLTDTIFWFKPNE